MKRRKKEEVPGSRALRGKRVVEIRGGAFMRRSHGFVGAFGLGEAPRHKKP